MMERGKEEEGVVAVPATITDEGRVIKGGGRGGCMGNGGWAKRPRKCPKIENIKSDISILCPFFSLSCLPWHLRYLPFIAQIKG